MRIFCGELQHFLHYVMRYGDEYGSRHSPSASFFIVFVAVMVVVLRNYQLNDSRRSPRSHSVTHVIAEQTVLIP